MAAEETLLDTLDRFYRGRYHEDVLELARDYPRDETSLYVSWQDLYAVDSQFADEYLELPDEANKQLVEPDGFGLIRNWTDHCETEVISYPGNAQGISIWDSSKGTVRIENPSIKNQGEHAIYGSKADAVEVVGGELIDNANTNLRIAGEGSFAEDCRIGYERDVEYTDHKRSEGRKATKIVRIEDSRDGASGGYLKDCEVFCETDGLVTGRLAFVMGNSGGFTFDDVTFRNNSDSRWCVVQAIGDGWRELEPPDEHWVRFRSCEFEGDGPGEHIEDQRGGGPVTVEWLLFSGVSGRSQGFLSVRD